MSNPYWDRIWQRKALEQEGDLKTICGWEKVNISSSSVVKTIKSRLDLKDNTSVLDLGCAAGFLTKSFLLETQNYTGSDPSQNMVNLAKSIFDCDFINCEASNLPFEDQQFDYIVAYSIFQYFPSDDYAKKTISEMNRVSKKGIYIGDLPISSHDDEHMLYSAKQFEGWITSEGMYTDKRFDAWKIKYE